MTTYDVSIVAVNKIGIGYFSPTFHAVTKGKKKILSLFVTIVTKFQEVK